MINSPSGLAILSAVFLIIGIFALLAHNKTISTRQSSTQMLMLLIGIGGLFGIKGYYAVGITIAVIALVAYFIRWRRFKKYQRYCREKGVRMPEYEKP